MIKDYTTSDGTVDINESNEEEQFKKIINEDKSSPENHIYNYLERCIIYIGCDFPPDLLQLLKKSILFGGGIRYSEFNSKVTHFVIKDKFNINKRYIFYINKWIKILILIIYTNIYKVLFI